MTQAPPGGEVESGTVNVYVPAPGNIRLRQLAPRSALVGTPESQHVLLDFEGNLHGASNLQRYGERLQQAFWRHVRRYPTRARWLVEAEDVVCVGTYTRPSLHDSGQFDQTREQVRALMAYLGMMAFEISTDLYPVRHHEVPPRTRWRGRARGV